MVPLNGTELFQVCYVARDRASAIHDLGARLGVSRWTQFEPTMQIASGGTASVRAAFARWGRVVLEVIEPLEGEVGVFRDALPDGPAPRLHHVGLRVASLDAAIRDAAGHGYPLVLGGHFEDEMQFAFVDARDELGFHLELVQFNASGWTFISHTLEEDA